MKDFILYVLSVSLFTSFILSLLQKWGVIEWVQVHGNKLFSEMFRCNFCLSFWVSLIISVVIVLLTGNVVLLFIPFFSTPITKNL